MTTATTTRPHRSTTSKPAKSAEQHKAEREELLAQLNGKVASLTSSEDWIAYLNFAQAFRRYSFSNQMLILSQLPDATRVAGFRKWQEFGRQVRKGEKSIKIFGYSSRKVTRVDPSTGQEEEGRVPTFPILHVFDVSQTDGDALPEGGECQLPDSDEHAATLAQLEAWLASEGWTVESEELREGLEGYTTHTGKRIALNGKLGIDGRLAVLIHEAAHALLHEDNGSYVAHRGLCETEAESVAYVLAGLIGLSLDASSVHYIAGWSDSKPEVLQAAAQNVLKAVNAIAAGIGLDEAGESE